MTLDQNMAIEIFRQLVELNKALVLVAEEVKALRENVETIVGILDREQKG